MREIEFRGMAKEPSAFEQIVNGWAYGASFENKIISRNTMEDSEYRNFVSEIDVDPATISQFTGLRDKNDKKIFEGDIGWDDHTECWGVVVFDEGRFQYVWETVADDLYEVTGDIEIRGNKWQNPELLGVE